ncbi:MAG: NOP58 family protein [Candidatus Nanohaloarchaeota archaeon QJJ-5]|nr:NOP58 family protein [Candidatus Nanohaloarchaeota archaeon QJJ-5]
MVTAVTTVLGVFLLDEDDTIVEHHLFETDPTAIAETLLDGPRILEDFADEYDIEEHVQYDPYELGKRVDAVGSREELYERQHAVATAYTKEKIDRQQSDDQVLVQATRALDDIDTILNTMTERLRPWYGLYFPEFEDKTDDHEELASTIATTFDRTEIDADTDSTGIDLDEADKDPIKQFAGETSNLYELRDTLETYVESRAEQIAPNVTAVLGKLLAARMIAETGSLEKLAKMPSSTIQVLGAEKALFRHMRGEGSAPKHGILFMHQKVRSLPDDKRGKMARFIANKTSIAARLDHYGSTYKGDSLRTAIADKYEEVREE